MSALAITPPNTEGHAALQDAMAEAESELIDIHRRIVQSPSVNRGDGSSAGEAAVAAIMAEYLRPHGFQIRVVESAPGRANLLASLPPQSKIQNPKSKILLWISHSDVVPTGDEKAWRFPPFSAQLADGRIWGRGSNDCKMLVAAELFAAVTLARIGAPLAGELRIAVGADEEAGGKLGFGWLAKHEAEFLKADLCVNEGGGAYFGRGEGANRVFLLGCGEKGRFEVRFTAKGPGAHASTPWGKHNPLVRIAQLAGRIAAWEAPARPASPIFQRLRSCMGIPADETLRSVIDEAGRRYSASFRNSLMAQSRVTVVPTMFESGDKSNALPARAALVCDARILPGSARQDLDRAIAELLDGFEGIDTEVIETAEPSVSPFTSEIADLFTRALDRTYAGESGGCAVMPTWCTGFTDSRFIRSVGTPAYGFQVVDPRADADRLGIHCIDESIEASMLLPCAQALGHLALDFLA